MFLTQTQINKLREKVENNMSTDKKLSKAQINKLIKKGGALRSILTRFLPKLIKPDATIQKKMYGSGGKIVRFSNKDLDDMTKNVKALEDSDVLMKRVTKTLQNDIKREVLCL